MPRPLPPTTLVGRHVQLVPLRRDHIADLVDAASFDRSTYQYTWVPDGADEMTGYVEQLLDAHDAGEALPFAQIDQRTGRAVGCTRLLELRWWSGRDEPDEVEIGGTWLSGTAQHTGINTEAKRLLLGHAFDVLDVWRVAICTDDENVRSRTAIDRIGATFEGVLRNHRRKYNAPTPRPRDTAVYSVVRADWPAVRTRLDLLLR